MLSRRSFLKGTAAAAAGAGVVSTGLLRTTAATLRPPGSLPDPRLPAGTHAVPRVEHIVIVMMENHSFDNYFGMLGRPGVDGFALDSAGRPTATQPDGNGHLVRAFPMPTPCQPSNQGPSQSWDASHLSYANGAMDGWVKASGPIAMGYWDGGTLPFYYGLASTFPVCDRWFASVMAQTYPNRHFELAGTAGGLVSDPLPTLSDPPPANGTIFDRLDHYGVSWKNYYADVPEVLLFPYVFNRDPTKVAKIAQFPIDAAAGALPAVTFISPPAVGEGSEENGDIQVGETYVASAVNAVLQGPGWPQTVLLYLYDEHGGYYDHVPPPPAVSPDAIGPQIHVPPDPPGAYDRYGFRVPAVVVSPFARRGYVSHVVHDHTSILKLIETVWNLPALTFRDANADNLLDSLDLVGAPAFLEPPTLPAPGAVSHPSTCQKTGAGVIPPAEALLAAPAATTSLPNGRAGTGRIAPGSGEPGPGLLAGLGLGAAAAGALLLRRRWGTRSATEPAAEPPSERAE